MEPEKTLSGRDSPFQPEIGQRLGLAQAEIGQPIILSVKSLA